MSSRRSLRTTLRLEGSSVAEWSPSRSTRRITTTSARVRLREGAAQSPAMAMMSRKSLWEQGPGRACLPTRRHHKDHRRKDCGRRTLAALLLAQRRGRHSRRVRHRTWAKIFSTPRYRLDDGGPAAHFRAGTRHTTSSSPLIELSSLALTRSVLFPCPTVTSSYLCSSPCPILLISIQSRPRRIGTRL